MPLAQWPEEVGPGRWSAMRPPCQAHQLQGQGGHWQLQISSQEHKTIQPERYPPCQPPRDLMRPWRRPPGKVARTKTGRRDCTRPGRAPTVRHGHKGPSWCQRIPWIKGRENSPADAKAYRRHKAGLKIKKPMVTKGQNGMASPTIKKTKDKVPKEDAAQRTREESKAKAAAAPKDSGSKMIPVPRRQKSPRAHEDLACLSRPHHPKGPVRRQKPRIRGGGGERLRF